MKQIKSLALLLLLGVSTVFIGVQNSYAATNIDKQYGLVYDMSKFTMPYVNTSLLKGYKSSLTENQGPRSLFYKRYIDGKMTDADRVFIKECQGDKACVDTFVRDMKYEYERRDTDIGILKTKVQAFQDKVNVDTGVGAPLAFIESKYGKGRYDWIIKNRGALDKAFDTYIEKERNNIRLGKIKAIIDSSGEEKLIEIFQGYVHHVGWTKLENSKNKSKTLLAKAAYEYYQYRLVTDTRLFIKQ